MHLARHLPVVVAWRALRRLTSVPLLLLSSTAPSPAQDVVPEGLMPGIEFLNERLRIPDSDRYDEADYLDTGVGLSFGVDKRLAYYPGQYAEAAQRFEAATTVYPTKAEIWVYLARAYFHDESPEQARDALRRAEALMPDLAERLWQPLVASLEWVIRQRAVRQQAQVDFYSSDQQALLSLFRLYLFLQDYDSAQRVIDNAFMRSRLMLERARMVSGASRRSNVAQADLWTQLGESLTTELRAAGVQAPDPPAPAPTADPMPPSPDVDEEERLRVLQLRIDFYRVDTADYQELFQSYLARSEPARAQAVLDALQRDVASRRIRASVAPTITEQVEIEQEAEDLRQVGEALRLQLPAPAAPGDAGG